MTLGFLKILQHFVVGLIPSNILFSPWTIVEWKKLDFQCCKATYVFRNHLLKSIRALSKLIHNIHNPPRGDFLPD